eukprot:m.631246 g.631246  ORF g.631246 m.631246 type:complete len:251 (+) comp22573_c0_seq3:164-916(+)
MCITMKLPSKFMRVEILVFLAALRTCFGDRADSKPTQRAAVVSVESSASYRGERKSGIHSEPHGFGRMEWSNGDVYTGYFADGRPHGDGQFKHSSGHVSEGYWRHGVRVDSPPHPDSKLHPDPNLYPESQLPAGKQAGVVKGGRSWGQFMVSRSLTAKDEQTFYDVAALAELTQVNVNATDAPMLAVTMHVERTDSNGEVALHGRNASSWSRIHYLYTLASRRIDDTIAGGRSKMDHAIRAVPSSSGPFT